MFRHQNPQKVFFVSRKLSGLVLITLLVLSVGCNSEEKFGGTPSLTRADPTQVNQATLPSTKPTSAASTQLVSSPTTNPLNSATTQPGSTSLSEQKGTPLAMSNKPAPANWWQPTPDQPIHWHWQLSDVFVFPRDIRPGVTVYDIDGELNSAETVAKLHSLGPDIKVICYFDAGVFESYRSDAGRFPKAVIGKADKGWNNSYWMDIRQLDILLPIMKDRMQKWCKDKGFDAIEPDETEVWSNEPGFPITKEENNLYNQKIAELAHSLGLSVGLKGNTSETPDLWPYFDWNLNEQCWEFEECEVLKTSFIDHGKAVFNIEYNVNPACKQANAWHINSARRDLNLVGPTNSKFRYTPCIPDAKNGW